MADNSFQRWDAQRNNSQRETDRFTREDSDLSGDGRDGEGTMDDDME